MTACEAFGKRKSSNLIVVVLALASGFADGGASAGLPGSLAEALPQWVAQVCPGEATWQGDVLPWRLERTQPSGYVPLAVLPLGEGRFVLPAYRNIVSAGTQLVWNRWLPAPRPGDWRWARGWTMFLERPPLRSAFRCLFVEHGKDGHELLWLGGDALDSVTESTPVYRLLCEGEWQAMETVPRIEVLAEVNAELRRKWVLTQVTQEEPRQLQVINSLGEMLATSALPSLDVPEGTLLADWGTLASERGVWGVLAAVPKDTSDIRMAAMRLWVYRFDRSEGGRLILDRPWMAEWWGKVSIRLPEGVERVEEAYSQPALTRYPGELAVWIRYRLRYREERGDLYCLVSNIGQPQPYLLDTFGEYWQGATYQRWQRSAGRKLDLSYRPYQVARGEVQPVPLVGVSLSGEAMVSSILDELSYWRRKS